MARCLRDSKDREACAWDTGPCCHSWRYADYAKALRDELVQATSLFNQWGIGDARTNNGVLLLVAKDARRVEIECGVSLNYRFNSVWCNSMLKTNVVPALKEGNYGEGVLAAVKQIGAQGQYV